MASIRPDPPEREEPLSSDAATSVDERFKQQSVVTKLMKRPELGAIAGVILVTIFFLLTADHSMFTLSGVMNFMTPAAQLGILSIGAAMLMIGGEFDLSIGSMVAFSGTILISCWAGDTTPPTVCTANSWTVPVTGAVSSC